MVSGEGKISAEVLSRISRAYKQVNLHWLLTGDGEMLLEAPPEEKSPGVNEPSERYDVKGKGRLEELEERVERLEEAVRRLKIETKKK